MKRSTCTVKNKIVLWYICKLCTLVLSSDLVTNLLLQVKVLRSIRKIDPRDVILGQYKSSSRDKNGVILNGVDPTYCAAALYIDNARWDGVPFLVRVGTGLIKHR
jgi:glucose-6-phosphate 1-dehydrogenase